MVRRQKGLIALGAAAGAQRCRYFVMGHHHASSTVADVDGELLVNGSWVRPPTPTTHYPATASRPSGFTGHPKHGLTWRLNVKLRHENEKNGPKRYIIDGRRDVGSLLP